MIKYRRCSFYSMFIAALGSFTVLGQEPVPEIPPLAPERVELVIVLPPSAARDTCSEEWRQRILGITPSIFDALSEPVRYGECRAVLARLQTMAVPKECGDNPSVAAIETAVLESCLLEAQATQPSAPPNASEALTETYELMSEDGVATTTPLSATSSGGAALSFTERALYGLADFAVSTAKQGLIEEVANEFADRLCAEDAVFGTIRTKDLFGESCAALRQLPDPNASYVSLTAFGRTFQEALRRDVENLLPVVLTQTPSAEKWSRLVPVFLSLRDIVSKKVSANVIATRLLETSCRDDVNSENAKICSALQLSVLAAAAALDTGCADIASCRQLLGDLIRKHAIRRLDSWARTNNVDVACLARLPVSGNRTELVAWATNCALPVTIPDSLLASEQIRTIPLWHANELTVALRDAALSAAFAIRTGTPSEMVGRRFGDAVRAASQPLLPSKVQTDASGLLARIDPRLFDVADVAIDLYRLAEGIRRGDNPVTLSIAAARRAPCTGVSARDLGCGIRFLAVVGEAFIVKSANVDWMKVDRTDPQKYFDAVTNTLTLALANEENRDVRAWITSYLTDYGHNLDGVVVQLGTPVLDIADALKNLRAARTAATDRATAVDAASEELARAAFRFWRVALDVGAVRDERRPKAVAVLNSVEETWIQVRKHEYAVAVSSVIKLANDLDLPSPIPPRLKRYTPLVTAFAEADSPEEVSRAIEQFSVTAPSARAKQTFARSIGLDLLIGGTVGVVQEDGSGAEDSSVSPELALFVPLGFDFTRAEGRLGEHAGMFASLLDIGSLVAVRYRDGETQTNEHLDWRDFVAPGVFYRRAIVGSSFLWGGGLTLTSPFGGEDNAERALRFSVFLAYDRPILSFVSRVKE